MNAIFEFYYRNGFAIEYLLAIIVFLIPLRKRRSIRRAIPLVFGAALLVAVLGDMCYKSYNYTGDTGDIRIGLFLLVYLSGVVVFFVCAKITVWDALYGATCAYAAQHMSYLLTSVIETWFSLSVVAFIPLELAVCIVVFLLCYFCFAHNMVIDGCFQIRPWETIRTMIMVVPFAFILSILTVTTYSSVGTGGEALFLVCRLYGMFCCVFILYMQISIHKKILVENELSIRQTLWKKQLDQYQVSKSTMEAVSRKSHDLKYQLAAFSTGQVGQKELAEAFALVDSFDTNIHTGNETLDVIFTEKNQFCQQNGITFVCMIDGEKLSFMETTDQYVLFGNMIDNAINAVLKLPEGVERSIYITVRTEKKLLFIQTENPFVGELEFRDGLPKTTSGDELNHGYGMSSIRLICQTYQGSANAKARDGNFYLNIVIPLP